MSIDIRRRSSTPELTHDEAADWQRTYLASIERSRPGDRAGLVDVIDEQRTPTRLANGPDAAAAMRAALGRGSAPVDHPRGDQHRRAGRGRLWDQTHELLLVLDASACIVDANPAWPAALGWPIECLIGRSFDEFVHPVDDALLPTPWRVRADDPEPARFERRLRQADGGYRAVSWIMFHDGALIYATGRDVASERAAAVAYETTLAQLHQSQKMQAVGQLTSGLAHDFNNLLAPITHSLELIQRQVGRGEHDRVDQHASVALAATRRAAALTHRLLTFSRPQIADACATDVNQAIVGIAELVQRTVRPAIAVRLSCADALWRALIDANQFENALLNLAINARDAMPEGGQLTISTSNRLLDADQALALLIPAGPYLSISVADTGSGIPPDIVDHIFEPFFTTKPVGSGSGLGLAMVYGFVRQAGGQIRVESRVGHGTTFTLYLPRYDEPPVAGKPG